MAYIAKRFYLETQEASVIGRSADRAVAVEMMCEAIIDTYEREQDRSKSDIEDLLKKAKKDACHYYREQNGEVTSWFFVREDKDDDMEGE